jgi:hypothetical protein
MMCAGSIDTSITYRNSRLFSPVQGLPLAVVLLAWVAALSTTAWGKVAVAWDFTKGLQGWQGNKYVADLAVSAEGLAFRSTGNDAWIEGPAVDLPGEGLTRVQVRMSSNADAHGELFYGTVFEAGRSVRFTVQNDGQWHEYTLLIRESLGRGTRFRLDPAGSEGFIRVGAIEVQTLPVVPAPQFERPERPVATTAQPALVKRDELTVEHYQGGWGDFVIKVDGREMAAGYSAETIGLVLDEKTQWLSLREADVTYAFTRNGGRCEAVLKDSGGGQWRARRVFKAGAKPGTISVETTVVVDRDRQVAYLPWLTLFPGLDTFGACKTQGLFAGLEYLGDEPSGSEADITTAEHIRRAPDPVKITFPLMAIAHEGRYIGLIWEPSDTAAAVFDSPDGIYGSGAHVMALTAPAVGESRFENDLVAHTPFVLKANQPLTARALIVGGTGRTVVPAIQKYVELRGVPEVPRFEGGFDAAVTLLAHGWLDSAINEGGLFRHAVWGESFAAGPAGDALMYMDWLAHQVQDPGLADRLDKGRDLAVSRMPPGRPYTSTVSHTRTPAAPFVFGGLYPYVEQRQAEAQGFLNRFDEQGVKLYQPGKIDYSKTHFAKHANGYAAGDVVRILEAATMSADRELIEQGLALLDQQSVLYADTVPRGAQTWEVPLHTPDILASAHLVKAYTLGYIISGRQDYLEQARYWAWTGVPFVYLINPTEGEIGPYATIAVLGATNWQAPSWFGRPVQWCGLVYGSAVHLLSEYDSEGPWKTIAKGITATGLQMTWPPSDEKRQGLLPDVFELRAQHRDGPAINPGTVQAHVPELFDKGSLYDVRQLATKDWFVHAPCAIRDIREAPDSIAFAVDGWDRKVFYVLLSGVTKKPAGVTVRPTLADASASVTERPANFDFNPRQQLLAITLSGPSEIRVQSY